jgi:hypothetical protein
MQPLLTPNQFVAKWSQMRLKETQSLLPLDLIEELDHMHTSLDHAVLDAYGWGRTRRATSRSSSASSPSTWNGLGSRTDQTPCQSDASGQRGLDHETDDRQRETPI